MPAGRPEIAINWEEVEKYLVSGCNGVQIASILGVYPDTLYDRCVKIYKMNFTDFAAQKRQKGNSFLHAKQYQVAMSGNTSMLIWLGKQRLNQEESPKSTEGFDGSLAGLLDEIKKINKEITHEAGNDKKEDN